MSVSLDMSLPVLPKQTPLNVGFFYHFVVLRGILSLG